eukprot:38694-Prorocentrum_minimum.AAC.1
MKCLYLDDRALEGFNLLRLPLHALHHPAGEQGGQLGVRRGNMPSTQPIARGRGLITVMVMT